MKKQLGFITRLLLAGMGIGMLLLLIPHESPTELSFFTRTAHEGKLVFVLTLPGLATIPIPTGIFIALAGMAVAVLLAMSQSVKNFLGVALSRPRSVVPTLISVFLLIVSLLPPEPYFVSAGSATIVILAIGSLGIALAGAGLFPFLPSLCPRLSKTVRAILFERSHRALLAGCFLFFFVATNFISFAVFEHMPHVQDSIAQVFHANILAEGQLTAPAPPEPEFFQFLQMIMRDRWYSQYPPGHMLLLVPALLLGIPWIVNPLLGSFSILLLYYLGKELYSEETGRLAALLGSASPFLLFMSSEYMNHASALFFLLLFLLFFAKGLRTGRMSHGVLSGAALGWVILARPYSAAALALPFLLYGLVVLVRRGSALRQSTAGFAASLVIFLAVLLGFNFLTNGDPLTFGFQTLWGEQVNPGFGTLNAGEMHTPMKGLTQTLSTLNGLNKYLFEWPLPSMIFIAVLFASRRKGLWDFLLLACAFAVLAAYFVYWFQDWCFGPRFLYEASGPLILLTARGILAFPGWSREFLGTEADEDKMRVRAIGFVIIIVAVGWAANIPAHVRNYNNAYWGVDGKTIGLVQERGIDRGIVFVPPSKFGSVFPANDPFMRKELIFARDLGEANEQLLARFPLLPGYRIQSDTVVVIRK